MYGFASPQPDRGGQMRAESAPPVSVNAPAPEIASDEEDSWLWDLNDVWEWLWGEDEDGASEADSERGYLDQRDNASEQTPNGSTVAGDAQCSPTSMAMVILQRVGRDGFAAAASAAFAEIGQPRTPEELSGDPEHVVWDWIYARSEEQWKAAVGTAGWVANVAIHKQSLVMEATIESFCDIEAQVISDNGDTRALLEQIDGLPAVCSTNLTGAGHVVVLTGVRSDGVLVDDPYGARTSSGYLRNGTTIQDEGAPPSHRFKERPELAGASTTEPRSDWGDDVFFDWDEVEAWDIGKYVVAGA
jgi:hypothetical protein